MTRINAQSPVPHVVPTDARPHHSAAANGGTQDFPSLLHAKPEPLLSSDEAEQSQPQPKPKPPAPLPHQQDAKATLDHLIACRAISSHATGRSGRSTGSSATVLSPDCSNSGETVEGLDAVGLACVAERSAVLRAEYIRGMNARRAGSCWNGTDDAPPDCAPKDAAMAEDQPAAIVVWIPVETLRTPLQSVRPRRRRNPPPNEDHRRDEPGGDVDGTE